MTKGVIYKRIARFAPCHTRISPSGLTSKDANQRDRDENGRIFLGGITRADRPLCESDGR